MSFFLSFQWSRVYLFYTSSDIYPSMFLRLCSSISPPSYIKYYVMPNSVKVILVRSNLALKQPSLQHVPKLKEMSTLKQEMEHLAIYVRPSSSNFMNAYKKWNIIVCVWKEGWISHIAPTTKINLYIALLRPECVHHAMQRVLLDTIKRRYIMGTFLASLNLKQLPFIP